MVISSVIRILTETGPWKIGSFKDKCDRIEDRIGGDGHTGTMSQRDIFCNANLDLKRFGSGRMGVTVLSVDGEVA